MPKVRLKDAIAEIHGTLYDIVLKRSPQGEMIVTKRPDMSNVKWSPAQKAQRQRFREGAGLVSLLGLLKQLVRSGPALGERRQLRFGSGCAGHAHHGRHNANEEKTTKAVAHINLLGATGETYSPRSAVLIGFENAAQQSTQDFLFVKNILARYHGIMVRRPVEFDRSNG